MSTLYVANQNGDWWSINTSTKQGLTLFVISEADLRKAIANEEGEEGETGRLAWTREGIQSRDKLERVITEHGEAIDLSDSF